MSEDDFIRMIAHVIVFGVPTCLGAFLLANAPSREDYTSQWHCIFWGILLLIFVLGR